jgi:hypothetical protein
MRNRPEVRVRQNFESVRMLPIALRPGEAALVSVAGVVGALLGVLGLFALAPLTVDGFAALVLGAGMAFEAGAFIAAVGRSGRNAEWGSAPNTGGFTGELIFGLLGVGLAIFSLAISSDAGSINLAALSVLSLGIALWIGSAAGSGVRTRISELDSPDRTPISASTWLCVLLAFSAMLLGIGALFSFSPRPLTLIAVIALGGGLLVSGIGKTRRVVETL